MICRQLAALAAASVVGIGGVAAQTPPASVPPEVAIWPNGAPGALGKAESDRPALFIYRPAAGTANGAAVVVCPGGGYGMLAIDHEGHEVARWFASFGVTAAVLRYRHAPDYKQPIPLGDAQRAIRYLRANAKDLGIDVKRIGIMGFSAGGHLSASAATKWVNAVPNAADPLDRVTSRPDFAVLAYPVITLTSPYTHTGSRDNLLGPNAPAALIAENSPEQHVTRDTPPTFLFSTTNDDAVPVENSLMFYTALRKAGVPAELHIYRAGPHGMGLNRYAPDATWPSLLKDWLQNLGMLKAG
ncbi:MAG TPA: alpha/beta hydrolase [Armatimonadota bacterium]|jgi:acetyl esterase/lipase